MIDSEVTSEQAIVVNGAKMASVRDPPVTTPWGTQVFAIVRRQKYPAAPRPKLRASLRRGLTTVRGT